MHRKKSILYLIVTVLSIVGSQSATYAQPLDSLFRLVVDQNPELSAVQRNYEAILSRTDQVSQLPNPQLGIGVPVLRPETRLGPQLVMVGASQMFPWFGTLSSKEELVISMSKAKYEELMALKLNLYFDLKQRYFMIDFINQKKTVINNRLELFRSLEKIALAKVESGEAMISDVLRIQLKIKELKEILNVLNNNKMSLELGINQLTNRDWNKKTDIVDLEAEEVAIEFDTVMYVEKIKSHPLIAMLNHQIEVSDNRKVVSKKMNSPVIGVGIDYNLVGKRTDANPSSNGRDILVPKLMLRLPIYRKSYQAKIREEELKQEEYNFKKEAITDKIMMQLLQSKLEYDNSILDIKLHKDQIDLTNRAIEIMLAAYSSDGSGFDEILQMENQLLEHEIGLAYGYYNMRLSIAKIERLTDYDTL